MTKTHTPLYTIAARIRRMENMHIVFWLLKDISWCMVWKELAIAMIIPASIAVWIAWKNRAIPSELAHNLAVVFWITADAYWMISEFYGFEETILWKQFTGKHLALIPFIAGVLVLLYYYAVQRPREIKLKKSVTL